MIDVVIPSVTGREDSLERLIDSYKRHTAEGVLSFIVIKDEATVGIGWQKGIDLSTAPYVALSCDDLEVTSSTWAGACCEAADEGYIACPVVHRPDGSLESCGGDMNSAACLISHMQPDRTLCDFSVVPFLSREMADRIGCHSGHYKTDTYISHKGRQLGWETMVRTDYVFTHHHSNVKRLSPSPNDDREYAEAMARE